MSEPSPPPPPASALSQDEIDALQLSGLHRDTPFMIQDVSHGYFSVARHTGGISYNGSHYTYRPDTDELVRDDVIKWQSKRNRKSSAGTRKAKAKNAQPNTTVDRKRPLFD